MLRGRLPPASRPPSLDAEELRPPRRPPPKPRRHPRRKGGGGADRRGRAGWRYTRTPAQARGRRRPLFTAEPPARPQPLPSPTSSPAGFPRDPQTTPRLAWDPGFLNRNLGPGPNTQGDLGPCLTSFEDPEHVLQPPGTTNHVLLSLVTSDSPHTHQRPQSVCSRIPGIQTTPIPIRDTESHPNIQVDPHPLPQSPRPYVKVQGNPRSCLTLFGDHPMFYSHTRPQTISHSLRTPGHVLHSLGPQTIP